MTNWDSVYRKHAPTIRYIGRMQGLPMCDLDDLVQESLLRLWQSSVTDRTDQYLYRIARNKAVDMKRRARHRERYTYPKDGYECSMFRLVDTDHDIDRLLSQCSEPMQNIFGLVASGFTYEEIGAMVGVPSGTVKARVSEWRSKFREEVGK